MRVVAMSDLHGRHKKIKQIPDGDVLVISGDLTPAGELGNLGSFVRWLEKQPHTHKVVIAGNHDWCFQNQHGPVSREMMSSFHYLEDSFVDIEGVRFYGSPWQPEFCDWAFNLPRGEKILRVWKLIPEDTDVLITHGPPAGILDRVKGDEEHLGCEDLRAEIFERVLPKVHIFGHIHSAHGEKDVAGIKFINASLLDEEYDPVYRPIVVDVD